MYQVVRRNWATRTGHGEKIPFHIEACVQSAAHLATAEAICRAGGPQRPQEASVCYYSSRVAVLCLVLLRLISHHATTAETIGSSLLCVSFMLHNFSCCRDHFVSCRCSKISNASFATIAGARVIREAIPCVQSARSSTRVAPARREEGISSFLFSAVLVCIRVSLFLAGKVTRVAATTMPRCNH